MWINYIFLAFIGFCSGIIIAGGVFAFIAIIGLVPRLIQKTNTNDYAQVYEDAITLGGIFGVVCINWGFRMPVGMVGAAIFGLFGGMFVGGIAVSLAEVLDVIPILTRRINIQVGMAWFIVALAIGKMIGSLVYFLIPGFTQFK